MSRCSPCVGKLRGGYGVTQRRGAGKQEECVQRRRGAREGTEGKKGGKGLKTERMKGKTRSKASEMRKGKGLS